jgi:hypothetical protein
MWCHSTHQVPIDQRETARAASIFSPNISLEYIYNVNLFKVHESAMWSSFSNNFNGLPFDEESVPNAVSAVSSFSEQ